MENPIFDLEDNEINRKSVKFLACGDLDAYDSDKTYKLKEAYVSLDPIQKPIDPPYKTFIKKRQNQ
jgi:tRNA (cytidine32/guanosine34-2'-O)-methyltransferase